MNIIFRFSLVEIVLLINIQIKTRKNTHCNMTNYLKYDSMRILISYDIISYLQVGIRYTYTHSYINIRMDLNMDIFEIPCF